MRLPNVMQMISQQMTYQTEVNSRLVKVFYIFANLALARFYAQYFLVPQHNIAKREYVMDTVLIVEDEPDIAELIGVNLNEIALKTCHVISGEEALQVLEKEAYALVLVDVMLPGMSGLDLCRQIRERYPEQALIFLTSRDSEIDRVLGLELGADDYMTKPFSVRELQARVRSQLRRVKLLANLQAQSSSSVCENLHIGNLMIDQSTHQIQLSGQDIELTAKEFELLHYLASHPEQVFSREQLLSSVWGYHHSGYEHTVNSHINRLRSKVEKDAAKPEIVQTVWGVGYKFSRQGVFA